VGLDVPEPADELNGSDEPTFTFLPPSDNGTVPQCATPSANCPTYMTGPHSSFSDPYNSFWRSAMDHAEQSEGTEDAAKIDVEYKFDDNLARLGQGRRALVGT
jgi:hypothetical protein